MNSSLIFFSFYFFKFLLGSGTQGSPDLAISCYTYHREGDAIALLGKNGTQSILLNQQQLQSKSFPSSWESDEGGGGKGVRYFWKR